MAFNLFKSKTAAAQKQAKADYIRAAELKGDSREVRAFKMRIALRCRAHVDNVFIEGAKKDSSISRQCYASGISGKGETRAA
jgi:hypothetical protein